MVRSCGTPSPRGASAGFLAVLACAVIGGLLPGGARAQGWSGGGPEIGWIRDLLEAQDGDLYAATWGGGIFRSADGGRHWVEATSNVRDAVVIDLHESPEFPSYIYAATSDYSFLRRALGSSFWAPLGGFPVGYSPPGLSLATFPTRETRVAYGTEFGVYVSNSYGADWPDTLSYAAGQIVNDLLVLDELPATIHAITPFELLVTDDTGESVQFYSEGLAPITYLIDAEAWSSGPDSILVADQRGPLWQFVERQRFEFVGPTEPLPASNKYFTRIDPDDPDRILMGSSDGLWRSPDRLASWELVDDAMPAEGSEIWAIDAAHVGATDSLRLGSFTLGFVRTGPGGDAPWAMSNSGLTAAWARSIHPAGPQALCGTAHGRLYRSTDDGASWDDVTGGLRTLQISVAHDTGSAWIVSGSTGVFRSVDGGVSWSAVALPGNVTRLNRVVQSADTLLAATNSGLVLSDDDGESFTQVVGVATDRACFALARSRDGVLAVGLDRLGPQPPSIAVGQPGAGFAELSLPVGFQAGIRGLGFIGPDLIVGANGFGGSPLYRIGGWAGPEFPGFTDLSASIGDGFFETRDLAVRGNLVVLGTGDHGVFLSEDSAASWLEWNEDLPSLRVESLAIESAPSRGVWVATLGRGVYRRELDPGVPVAVSSLSAGVGSDGVEITMRVEAPEQIRVWRRSFHLGDQLLFEGQARADLVLNDRLPAGADPQLAIAYAVEVWAFDRWLEVTRIERQVRDLVAAVRSRLLAAVPNPFNPRTELRFELARAGRVQLEIYDVRGRRVRNLVDRDLGAGPHTTSFDGCDDDGAALASGVYYVRILTPDSTLHGRVTLVR